MTSTQNNDQTRRRLRICIVGAGLGGLCAAIKIKASFFKSNPKVQLELVIYEQNAEVGGVWLTNTYPGAEADIPGQVYSFSFCQNPKWSKTCPSQGEMWNYIHNVANDYELYSYIQFNTIVKSMSWIQEQQLWRVNLTKTNPKISAITESSLDYDIMILATGAFHTPKIPTELSLFDGPCMHSAEWNPNIDLKDKVVGVVGSGASAIQIIPAIAKQTKELIVYSRSSLYILPKIDFKIPKCLQLLFGLLPCLLWIFRGILYAGTEFGALLLNAGSFINWIGQIILLACMKRSIRNPELWPKLKPKHVIGSKPPLFSNNYLQAFRLPNVTLNTGNIRKVEGQTIYTDNGESKEIDVLICCTGFKVHDYFAPLVIKGLNGIDVLQSWKQNVPQTYYGITAHETPNCFFILGPNTIAVHSPSTHVIECQVNLIVQLLKKMIQSRASSVKIKLDAVQASMKDLNKAINSRVYGRFAQDFDTNIESSWITNDKGAVTTLNPFSGFGYWWRTRRLKVDKFIWNYYKEEDIKGNNDCNEIVIV